MAETPSTLPEKLVERLAELAQVPQLLVATDYDGTIAPIVNDPMRAVPDRETAVALRMLATLDQTHVGVISSRALRDLAALSRLPSEIHLVGSHGSEFDVDFALQMDRETQARRDSLGNSLTEICRRYPGTSLEQKPASVAFHTRNAPPATVADAIREVEALAATNDTLTYRAGKMVCEVGVMRTNKGGALETLRANLSATAVLFVGDDTTDEDAFATLGGPDVGVKVGDGDTSAQFRIHDTDDVALLLVTLCTLRSDWLAGAGLVPIEQHSLLSDQRTAAIVTPDARVTWFCAPRLDDAAIFAELLGGPTAGYFSVRNADARSPSLQRYAGSTMILETIWPDITVTDYLDVSDGRPTLLAGRSDLIRHLSGSGTAIVEFAPRLDFGRFPSHIELKADGVEVIGARDLIVLRAPGVEWTLEQAGQHQTAVAMIDLSSGPVTLELRVGTASLREGATESRKRNLTRHFWADWADRLELPSAATEHVRRSALVLKALVYGPSGGIAAAATTSLPEHIGGIRNWGLSLLLASRCCIQRRCSRPIGKPRGGNGLPRLGVACTRRRRRASRAPQSALLARRRQAATRSRYHRALWIRRITSGSGRQRGRQPSPVWMCSGRSSTWFTSSANEALHSRLATGVSSKKWSKRSSSGGPNPITESGRSVLPLGTTCIRR